jgi:DNA-directed RNA polymerase specialized sigma24 family protein
MITSATGAPANYAELYEHYFGFVRNIVIKAGIRVEDADDVTHEMLCKFMEKDALAWYDGEMMHSHADGGRRKARFPTFLAGFVSKYVLNERDKQYRRVRREVLSDETVPMADESATMDVLTLVEMAEWVAKAQEHLDSIPMRGRRDLARVFRMVVEQVELDGKTDRKQIARELSVSDTAVCSMFKDLRGVLVETGFRADLSS